jgi:arylsulfatase B
MRREVWVTALVGWVACAEDGGALATPAVRLVVPEGGVRVGAGPACAAETRAGWTHGRLFWDRDGVEVPGDAAGPAPGEWAKGDTLVCVVAFTHDSTGARLWVRSDEAVVGNAAPTAPSVSVSPALLSPRDLARCEAAATDPDGDAVTLRRVWLVDGAAVAEGEELRSWFPPGAEVRCEVVASDGVDDGPVGEGQATVAEASLGGNVLVVLLDDVGIDMLTSRAASAGGASTPTLDGLAAEGVTFTRAYAQPVCSPTRASLLTGRAPHQHGIGSQTKYGQRGWVLQESELTLPEALRAAPYTSAAIGKWHLDRRGEGGAMSPAIAGGFDTFAVMDDNLLGAGEDGVDLDYFSWELNEEGTYRRVERYNTSALAELALAQTEALPEPWFVYLAFAAAHTPLHVPPRDLIHLDPGAFWSGSEKMDAMLEAADTELGMLLAAMDPALRARTTVVVTADNGTLTEMLGPPFPAGRGKGTVYEGGVRVPLVVSGPGIAAPGREVAHLVQLSDLFATVLDLAGVGPEWSLEDTGGSVSLLPYLVDPARPARRAWVMAERFSPLGLTGPYEFRDQMVRDDRLKLIRTQDGARSLYDLSVDPWEAEDLLAGPSASAWVAEADRLELALEGALAAP